MGHWVTVENAHLLRSWSTVWETERPVTHSTYPAHFPEPGWLHSQENRFRMPAQAMWASTSETYWPHMLQLCAEEGYLTNFRVGSVPHRTLSLGPETSTLSIVLTLNCISSLGQLFCSENRKPDGQAHSNCSIPVRTAFPGDRIGERGGLLAPTDHHPCPHGGMEATNTCRFSLCFFIFTILHGNFALWGTLHLAVS